MYEIELVDVVKKLGRIGLQNPLQLGWLHFASVDLYWESQLLYGGGGFVHQKTASRVQVIKICLCNC